AIGASARASGSAATALGGGSTADGLGSVAVGKFSYSHGEYATALGTMAVAYGDRSVAIGTSWVEQQATDSVALGHGSVASRANTVSVGASKEWWDRMGDYHGVMQRQITDVAAGTQDHDAVNLAQLKGVEAKAGSGRFIAVDGTDDGSEDPFANGKGATAIGPQASAEGAGSLAAGHQANAIGADAISMGAQALALG